MQKVTQSIRGLVWRLYRTWLDWLYVSFWQVWYFVRRGDPAAYASPTHPHKTVIVMIPGVYEPWQFMNPLAKMLHGHSYRVHVIEALRYNSGDVPHMAAIVANYVDSLDSEHIVLVTHSKGGLIAKYVMAKYNRDQRIRHAIAINSPYSGSIYAKFAPVRSIRIFTPKGRTIRQLQANRVINSTITSIYSEYDPHIPAGSFLEGATNIPVRTIGHFKIIADPLLHHEVIKVLTAMEAIADLS
jgi:triacylglycerol lipase